MSLSTILDVNNKQKRDYTCLLSDSRNIKRGLGKINPSQTQNKKRKERRKNDRKDRLHAQTEANKNIKNLSNIALTSDQTNLLAKGLKFIPTPKENETQIRRHILKDFENFTRRMRLQYIFFGEDNEPHPFHVKSNWIPPVQKSVAVESYLEEVKVQLAETHLTKPKDNLLNTERKALKTLRENANINLKSKCSVSKLVKRTNEFKYFFGLCSLFLVRPCKFQILKSDDLNRDKICVTSAFHQIWTVK